MNNLVLLPSTRVCLDKWNATMNLQILNREGQDGDHWHVSAMLSAEHDSQIVCEEVCFLIAQGIVSNVNVNVFAVLKRTCPDNHCVAQDSRFCKRSKVGNKVGLDHSESTFQEELHTINLPVFLHADNHCNVIARRPVKLGCRSMVVNCGGLKLY
jgi:hypothetical protein